MSLLGKQAPRFVSVGPAEEQMSHWSSLQNGTMPLLANPIPDAADRYPSALLLLVTLALSRAVHPVDTSPVRLPCSLIVALTVGSRRPLLCARYLISPAAHVAMSAVWHRKTPPS